MNVEAIHIDDGQRFLKRVNRRHRIKLRTQESLFLSGDGEKQDRAFGSRAQSLKSPPNLEERCRAGSVVNGAIVDVVAVDGLPPAQVVPVGRVNHVLILECGSLPSSFATRSVSRPCAIVLSPTEAVVPSDTGLKSRVAACFLRHRNLPDRASSAFA